MRNYALEVQNELNSLKSIMTDEEFFSSDFFSRYLENYIKSSVQGWKRGKQIIVHNTFDPEGALTACTNGNLVKNNIYDSIIQKMDDRSDKFYGNCGKVSHEIWHILFTNFQTHMAHVNAWESKEFEWLVQPTHPKADEVKKALNTQRNVKVLMKRLMQQIANIYEDAYINIKGCLAMPGIPANGFILYNNTLIREYGTLNKILDNDVLLALLQIMHLKSMNAPLKMDGKITEEQEQKYLYIKEILDSASVYTNALLYESNGKERARLVDEVLICLYPMVKELIPENPGEGGSGDEGNAEESDSEGTSQGSEGKSKSSSSNESSESSENDSSSSSSESSSSSDRSDSSSNSSDCESSSDGSESSDITEEVLEQLLKDIEEKMNETEVPEGNTTPVDDDFSKEEMEEKNKEMSEKTESESTGMDEDAAKQAFDSIESEVMEDISKKNVEVQHSKDLKDESKEIMKGLEEESFKEMEADMNLASGKYTENLKYEGAKIYHYNVRRMTGINEGILRRYEMESSYVEEQANTTIRQLKKILKDQEKSMFATGYRMGGRFDAKSVARSEFYKDGKIFKRKTEKSTADVCFSLLIDESGSMSIHSKIRQARKTAILLEKVLTELDIPFMITGHTQIGDRDVTMDVFKDFDSVDGEDKYRLSSIEAQGNNVDGMAIAYNCEKLLKRNEKKKVLIVISDGLPCAYGMNNQDSLKLAIQMVQKYRKKGIEVFGAVIDGEKERIQEIYGDRTMDCTDLESLSPELCGLVKRFIIKK